MAITQKNNFNWCNVMYSLDCYCFCYHYTCDACK